MLSPYQEKGQKWAWTLKSVFSTDDFIGERSVGTLIKKTNLGGNFDIWLQWRKSEPDIGLMKLWWYSDNLEKAIVYLTKALLKVHLWNMVSYVDFRCNELTVLPNCPQRQKQAGTGAFAQFWWRFFNA